MRHDPGPCIIMAGRDACAARASGVTLTASPARGAMLRKCCHDFLIAGIPKIVLGRLSGILQWARCAWSRAVHPKRQTAEAAETALEGACEAARGLANGQGGGGRKVKPTEFAESLRERCTVLGNGWAPAWFEIQIDTF